MLDDRSPLARSLAVLACAVVAACMQASEPPRQIDPASPRSDTVSVTGVLTDEGVECQAMRADDGTLYTLAGDLAGFEAGERVRVEGAIAELSFCMQGTTLGVQRIERR